MANGDKNDLNLDELSGHEAEAAAELPVLSGKEPEEREIRTASDLQAVYEIPVQVSAVLGKTKMEVSSLLKLSRGAVIELNRKVGEPVDVYLNDRLVARGEVVVVNDKLGITMTEIIKANKN